MQVEDTCGLRCSARFASAARRSTSLRRKTDAHNLHEKWKHIAFTCFSESSQLTPHKQTLYCNTRNDPNSPAYLTTVSVLVSDPAMEPMSLPGEDSTLSVICRSVCLACFVEYCITVEGIIGVSPSASSVNTFAAKTRCSVSVLSTRFIFRWIFHVPHLDAGIFPWLVLARLRAVFPRS